MLGGRGRRSYIRFGVKTQGTGVKTDTHPRDIGLILVTQIGYRLFRIWYVDAWFWPAVHLEQPELRSSISWTEKITIHISGHCEYPLVSATSFWTYILRVECTFSLWTFPDNIFSSRSALPWQSPFLQSSISCLDTKTGTQTHMFFYHVKTKFVLNNANTLIYVNFMLISVGKLINTSTAPY